MLVEGGHDSIEDASACMELMKWKVSKDITERAEHARASESKGAENKKKSKEKNKTMQ